MPRYRLHNERVKKVIYDVYYYIDADNKEDAIKKFEEGKVEQAGEKFDTAREYETLYELKEIKPDNTLGDDLLTDEDYETYYEV